MLATCTCLAQEKVKLAEGEYTVSKSGKPEMIGRTFDRWVLWRLKDKNVQAQIELEDVGGRLVQEFRFTPDFKPIGYALSASMKPDKKAGDEGNRFSLSCKLMPQFIQCGEELNGKKDACELSVKESQYVFMPGEFYGIDLSWFFVSVIQNESRDIERASYVLGESGSGQPVIEPDEPLKIHFAGPDSVVIMGKTILANRYELEDFKVWVLPSNGMVLAVAGTDDSGRWELTKFKSYSPAFLPELQ